MKDEDEFKKNMDAINIIAELMMNADGARPTEFSAGVVNNLGMLLSEAAERISDCVHDY